MQCKRLNPCTNSIYKIKGIQETTWSHISNALNRETRELSNFSVLSILLPGSASVIVVGDPRDLVLAALPGFDVVDVHPVELLESSVFTLNNEEVDHEDSDEETTREDVAVREIDGSGDEGSEKTKATVSTVRIRRY